MGDEKKGFVSSSMIDLKAELFRKQEEFKRQKAAGTGFVKGRSHEEGTKSGKGNIWSRQNPGVLKRAEKDLEVETETNEDDDMLARSRRALEEKSRLYEKITRSSTIPEEDGSDYYLVDFQKKAIDAIVEEREAKRKEDEKKREEEEEEAAERRALAEEIPESIDPEEEWVDFTDSLGRERRCMKKDLNQLMKQDRELALAQSKGKSVKKKTATNSEHEQSSEALPTLMSSDMHRELMRQKWENEAKELLDKGQKDIHYSNVRFDEIRNHGVGYFQFSKDHEKREEQLDDLKKMRDQTVDERSRKDRIKDKRKAMMEERLAKVRQRRKLKGGTVEGETDVNKEEEDIGPKLSQATLTQDVEAEAKKEEQEKEAEEKRKNHIREWDKDKKKDMPKKKNYIEECRDEREPDFAPPSAYFNEPANRHQISDEKRLKRLQTSLTRSNPEFAPPDSYKDGTKQQQTQDATSAPTITPVSHNVTDKPLTNSVSLPSHTYQHSIVSDSSSAASASTQAVGQWNEAYPGYSGYPQPPTYDQTGQMVTGQLTDPSQCNMQQYHQSQHYLQSQSQAYYHQQAGHEAPQQYDGYHSHHMPTQNYQHYQQFTTQTNPASGQYSDSGHISSYSGEAHYVNANNATSNISSTQSLVTKRLNIETETSSTAEVKKPKVPKMAIVDTRFVKNDVTPVVDETVSTHVTAVPYTPGSFTAAKQTTADQYAESVADSRQKSQISGGPHLYTKEQQQHQQKLLQSEGGDEADPEVEKKLQEFLSSVRNETS